MREPKSEFKVLLQKLVIFRNYASNLRVHTLISIKIYGGQF